MSLQRSISVSHKLPDDVVIVNEMMGQEADRLIAVRISVETQRSMTITMTGDDPHSIGQAFSCRCQSIGSTRVLI